MVGGGGKPDGEEGGSSSVWNIEQGENSTQSEKARLEKEGTSFSVWNKDKVKSLCKVGLGEHSLYKPMHCR